VQTERTQLYKDSDLNEVIDRKPHWLKGNKGNSIPKRLIFFDTETRAIDQGNGVDEHVLDFVTACYMVRTNKGKYTQPQWFYGEDIDSFWDWVETKAYAKSKLYMYAHNLMFDCSVLKVFKSLTKRNWDMKNPIIEDPPTVLKFEQSNPTKSIQLIDTMNYFPFSVKKIGEWVGLEKFDFEVSRKDPAAFKRYCERDVEIIAKAVTSFHSFIKDEDLGNVRITIASQAFSAYRHRFMPHSLYCSDSKFELGLARQAYTGGRAEAFFIGKIPEKVYCLDINSMYPAMMEQYPYPVEYDKFFLYPDVADIKQALEHRAVIADVELITEAAFYPLKYEGRLCFPTGHFRTTLTTPELMLALHFGHLKKVHAATSYKEYFIFRDWVNYFWEKRSEAKHQGDETASMLYKLMMNSLYGRMGMKASHWEEIGSCPPEQIRREMIYDVPTDTYTYQRRFAGIMQQKVERDESYDSIPSIAAHVTAYGRFFLGKLIQMAGKGNTFYCDTDSVFVNFKGYERLKGFIDPDKLGMLKLEWTSNDVEIHGLKDYRVDDRIKIKGIRPNAIKLSETQYQQTVFQGFKGALQRGQIDQQFVRQQVKNLSRIYHKGFVTDSGVVEPFILSYSDGVTSSASTS
jgi:hypothetical protein